MLLMLFFLLYEGDSLLRRFVEIMPTWADKRRTVQITSEIERNVSLYLATITGMNLLVGVANLIQCWLLGMPNPLLWGVVAFLLNYIPILGPLTGVVIYFFVGLFAYPSVLHALLPPAIYLGIHFLEGETITPMLLARRFTLNPVLVMASLMFWDWLWGIPGGVPQRAAARGVQDRLRPCRQPEGNRPRRRRRTQGTRRHELADAYLILRQRLAAYLTALLIGSVFVLRVFPHWALTGGLPPGAPPRPDFAQHVIGQLYFFAQPWNFSVGSLRGLLVARGLDAPDGLNIALTDSIPMLSLLAKLLRPVLPPFEQTITLFQAAAWLLQPVAAVFAMRSAGERRWLPAVAVSLMAVSMPTFLHRLWHAALSGHWFLLVALGLYFRIVRGSRPAVAAACVLPVVLLLVHPYLMLMASVLLLAAPLTLRLRGDPRWRGSLAAWVASSALVLLAGGVLGYWGSGSDGGYGYYSMNLAGPFWPTLSGLFPGIAYTPADATGGQAEGYQYLGLGLLGLVAFVAGRLAPVAAGDAPASRTADRLRGARRGRRHQLDLFPAHQAAAHSVPIAAVRATTLQRAVVLAGRLRPDDRLDPRRAAAVSAARHSRGAGGRPAAGRGCRRVAAGRSRQPHGHRGVSVRPAAPVGNPAGARHARGATDVSMQWPAASHRPWTCSGWPRSRASPSPRCIQPAPRMSSSACPGRPWRAAQHRARCA